MNTNKRNLRLVLRLYYRGTVKRRILKIGDLRFWRVMFEPLFPSTTPNFLTIPMISNSTWRVDLPRGGATGGGWGGGSYNDRFRDFFRPSCLDQNLVWNHLFPPSFQCRASFYRVHCVNTIVNVPSASCSLLWRCLQSP